MIFSDPPSPAEAGFREGEKPVSTPDQLGAGIFGITL
jgi:hypothetical protein